MLWSDEAYFAIDGAVASLRGSVWSKDSIVVQVEKQLCPQKLLVWCGFTRNVVIAPFIFEGTLDGDAYLEMLRNHVVQYLKPKRILARVWTNSENANSSFTRRKI